MAIDTVCLLFIMAGATMRVLSKIALGLVAATSFNAFSYEESISVSPFFGSVDFQYQLESQYIDKRYGSPTSELTFENMEVYGISLNYKKFDNTSFTDYGFYLGTGNGTGTFLDKDWYSDEYASSFGRDPLFSYTKSKAELEFYGKFTLNTGMSFDDLLGVDRTNLGMMSKFAYQQYTSFGLTPLVDSYGFEDTGNPVKNNSVEMVGIKTFTYSIGADLALKEHFGNNGYLSSHVTLFPYSATYTLDYHYQRSDLDGSFSVVSNNYGFDAGVRAGYLAHGYDLYASAETSMLFSYAPINEKYQRQIKNETLVFVGVEKKL